MDHRNGLISHWMHTTGPATPRIGPWPDEQVDIAIVGGGLTGLWLAYYASLERPEARIVVLEAEQVGYGASGRNGGWLSSLLPGNRAVYARTSGRDAVCAFQRAMLDGIDETLRVLDVEGVDADQVRGGNLTVATSRAGLGRLGAVRDRHLAGGYEDDEVALLDAAGVRERIDVAGARGGLFYPRTARVHPAKLVRGLADVVERRGVQILEQTRVTGVEAGTVRTGRGALRADTILLGLEAYASSLLSASVRLGRQDVIPVNSSMVVTRRLDAAEWRRIGWDGRECLNDAAHTFVYAQRTADDRIAIGGRGTPYRFASGTPGDGAVDDRTIRTLVGRLRAFFPGVDVRIAYAWRGAIGVTRDWCATVEFDATTGIGSAHGYAGHGVTATNVAARTLLDRALGRSTDLTHLPWNDHRSGRWEPEPIRWAGVHAMYRLFEVADAWEERMDTPSTSLLARGASRLAGLHE